MSESVRYIRYSVSCNLNCLIVIKLQNTDPDLFRQEEVSNLLPVFESFLDKAPTDQSYDAVRQSVVILMGSLARHLDKSDPKVKPIIGKLIEALSTPSQQVRITF